ncbi:hypothetical protein BKA01_005033 [Pseudonocardia eucalypti]|uniref:hypothetical protein n=1 Tax=Pseudonocardia eucalypti TaxID=648755 RepID=UPI00161409BA|nr:hypothetical protein [Pseudonocardia eucalypti]
MLAISGSISVLFGGAAVVVGSALGPAAPATGSVGETAPVQLAAAAQPLAARGSDDNGFSDADGHDGSSRTRSREGGGSSGFFSGSTGGGDSRREPEVREPESDGFFFGWFSNNDRPAVSDSGSRDRHREEWERKEREDVEKKKLEIDVNVHPAEPKASNVRDNGGDHDGDDDKDSRNGRSGGGSETSGAANPGGAILQFLSQLFSAILGMVKGMG